MTSEQNDNKNTESNPRPAGSISQQSGNLSGNGVILGYPAAQWIIAGVVFLVLFVGIVVYSSTEEHSSVKKNNSPQELVFNSAFDGSVYQVENWFSKNLKDPDSLEVIEWSKVSKAGGGKFIVRCKYRAKNSFGGFAIENKVFTLSSTGEVVGVSDFR